VSEVVDIGMPRLSDSMEEATILTWLKEPGDSFARGEPLVEVETDKATVVYEAEVDGVLEEIVVPDGETAELGALIARIRTDAAGAPRPSPKARATSREGRVRAAPKASGTARERRVQATPVARRLARQLNVDLEAVEGTGPGGRISVSDVEAAAGGPEAEVAAEDDGRGTPTVVEHSPTQRRIAERMAESRSSIPEFTLEAEIAMDAASTLRDELREAGRAPVPSFNDLVVRAAALALRDFPALNASYEPGRSIRHDRINVGVAVDAPDALLVPTIHDADRKPLLSIAAESRRLAEAARERRLTPEDLADGTFTVSNLGMFGVRRFHAVINPPQVAILAVGSVERRPFVDGDGTLVARRSMDVVLSCDHRVVYGAEAARFLERLRELLESPASLVAE
jgi:pyruvate dehydrogenase E2 component (dihydrolipoyllysine-residue acetyltransferase)